jgi:hypothetical protein
VEGVLVIGGEDEVGEVGHDEGVLALLLVVDGGVGDEVLELVGVFVEALDLVDLDEDAVEGAVGEAAEEVLVGVAGLVGGVGPEDGLAEELEDDALAAALLAEERDGDLPRRSQLGK